MIYKFEFMLIHGNPGPQIEYISYFIDIILMRVPFGSIFLRDPLLHFYSDEHSAN